ncbi:MAG: pyruvate kinase [Bernardetiaceae bacterium]
MQLPLKKTKIVATIGPASESVEVLRSLILAGVNVFRLNFSHGTHEQHAEVIRCIRRLNEEMGAGVAILQDLQGPKIRVGELEAPFEVQTGDTFLITNQEEIEGNRERISCTYPSVVRDIKIDDRVLIDDGKIELIVMDVERDHFQVKVIHGGTIKPRKGINLPDTVISAPALTDKDYQDLLFGLEQEVDWIALSFVRTAEELYYLRRLIKQQKGVARIIAKIERPEAIKNIDRIIDAADALMIARGDLGVEIKMEDVPMAQKSIVRKCIEATKPVIIATQMMESMIDNPRPTRAEAADVANGVMDGADALMLSGETAVGRYPVKVVESMTQIIRSVEESANIYNVFYNVDRSSPDFTSRSLIATGCWMSSETKAKAIIAMTQSGYTAFEISSRRPRANIFIFTKNKHILNMLNLVWGVSCYYYDRFESTDQTFQDTQQLLLEQKEIQRGDVVINLASMPIVERARTNTLKIDVVR